MFYVNKLDCYFRKCYFHMHSIMSNTTKFCSKQSKFVNFARNFCLWNNFQLALVSRVAKWWVQPSVGNETCRMKLSKTHHDCGAEQNCFPFRREMKGTGRDRWKQMEGRKEFLLIIGWCRREILRGWNENQIQFKYIGNRQKYIDEKQLYSNEWMLYNEILSNGHFFKCAFK